MSGKTLVVFFSYSGNTRRLAERIHTQSGGDLFELLPTAPYPQGYSAVVEQAKKELRKGILPALEQLPEGIEAYAHIYVGSPNWFNTIAPPLASFLSAYAFPGIEIHPFCTHGGGGPGGIQGAVTKLCPRARIDSCLAVHGNRV